jgi:hypothetical protein
MQIAIVHPQQRCRDRQSTAQLIGIVNLDQNIEPVFHRSSGQLLQLPITQCSHYQQYRIGTDRPRLRHLQYIDGEVFAQDRQVTGSTSAA